MNHNFSQEQWGLIEEVGIRSIHFYNCLHALVLPPWGVHRPPLHLDQGGLTLFFLDREATPWLARNVTKFRGFFLSFFVELRDTDRLCWPL